MISGNNCLIGKIVEKIRLIGKLNNKIIKEYPELDDLEVTPSESRQEFNHPNKYGYDQVVVKAIETENLNITPGKDAQSYNGLYKQVSVAGDNNLVESNIKNGVTIFGVTGNVKEGVDTTDANAVANDIVLGKTAYVNNQKLTGTYTGIVPTGTISITQNGTVDVTNYASANVNVGGSVDPVILPPGTTYNNMTLSNMDFLTNVDTSYMTSMYMMFQSCRQITSLDLSSFNTNKVTTMERMFYYCDKLTSLTTNSNFGANTTNFANTFSYCRFTSLPTLNTSKATSMKTMCFNCSLLTEIPLLDTSKVTDISSAFEGCRSLITFPLLDFTNVTTASRMLAGCRNLVSVPAFNFPKSVIMAYMFEECSSLTTVPQFNVSNISGTNNFNGMFTTCPALSDESLNNIMAMCTSATGYTGTKKLSKLGLSSTQIATCKTLSNYDAFVAAGWSAS